MANVGSLKKGDKVKCSAEYDWNGTHLASFVRKNTYTVIQVGGSNLSNKRIVIGINGQVTAAVDIKYLTAIGKTKTSNTKKDDKKAKKKKTNKKDTPKKTLPTKPPKNAIHYVKMGEGIKVVGRDPTPSEIDYHFPEETNFAPAVTSDALTPAQEQWLKDIELNNKNIIQNKYGFPTPKKGNEENKPKKWYYYQDYDTDTSIFKTASGDETKNMIYDMNGIRKSLNIISRSPYTDMPDPLVHNSKKYNRFKIQDPDEQLHKTFSHVFFVRPDCNIFADGKGPSTGMKVPTLKKALDVLPEFYYAKKHSPELLSQLTQTDVAYDHEFMLYLSNKARSFELSDEYIVSDTYGPAMTGYKIPYGKDNVESRTAEKFSISYIDDRDLHVYQLHKLWTDYISYVFRGKVYPKTPYIRNKIIDYATCVYYIVCGEDGESIIFWSKYWGVFPLNAPSSAFSYSAENPGGFAKPEIKIDYQYAWKEDYNPLSLVEFNMHANITEGKQKYIGPLLMQKVNDTDLKPYPTAGKTWVGVPFIETFGKNGAYEFKLRFKPN